MKSAGYSVVRVVADPARDEPMNVGIMLWSSSTVRIKIDVEAVSEVVRRHRFLTADALGFIEEYLWTSLTEFTTFLDDVDQALLEMSRFPVALSEPRQLAVLSESAASLDAELDRLVRRLVSPAKANWGRQGIKTRVRKELKPLVQRCLLKQDYEFSCSASGNHWSVDYFADAESRFALDVLPLKVNDANEIARRAAAQAFKFTDLAQQNAIDYTVFCEFNDDERYGEANERARRFLETAGAEVETNLDETVFKIRSLLTMPLMNAQAADKVRLIRTA